MSFYIDNNPVDVLLKVCNDLYPEFDAEIYLMSSEAIDKFYKESGGEGKAPFGITVGEDNDNYDILIDANVPYMALIEVLSHEIAHVVAGFEAEHGEEWEKVFSEIHGAYCEYFSDPTDEDLID